MPVALETFRVLLEIDAPVTWGSKEALRSEVAPIIRDNSPSGTSYSPQYTLISLHSSHAYFTEVCLINVGTLEEVKSRLEKKA